MIRSRSLVLFLVAIATFAAGLDLSSRHFRRPIPLTPGDKPAVVKLDRDVYSGARADLADLRVVRDGEEVPFIIETVAEATERAERLAEMFNQSVIPAVGLSVTLRVNAGLKHNSVRIETAERNFRQSVHIETSEDGKRWAIVRDNGAIFDFTQDNRRLSSLTVEYPVSAQPLVRLTIGGWTKVDAVTAAYVDYQEQRAAVRETLATITPRVIEDPKNQTTFAVLDAGVSGLPVDRIYIETPAESFLRAIDVEASSNGSDWRLVRQGAIERWSGQNTVTIDIPDTRDRYMRLRVYNRDDRPIGITGARLEGLIRKLRFLAAEKGDYYLYYGAGDARAPVYDLAAVLSHQKNENEAKAWTLAAVETNPAYRPPAEPVKPWSERHPFVLYSVLTGAVLALGIATVRFAMRIRRPAA